MSMLSQDEILQYLRRIKSTLHSEYGIQTIGLFGSYAKNLQRPDSDIDLLVEFEPNTPELFEKKEQLRETISRKFEKDVDICRKKYIKSYYRDLILDSVIYA